MKKEKKTLILEIDVFTLDIDFIKNDLAHIYRLKTKFQRDYTRPLPMHLFQQGQPAAALDIQEESKGERKN